MLKLSLNKAAHIVHALVSRNAQAAESRITQHICQIISLHPTVKSTVAQGRNGQDVQAGMLAVRQVTCRVHRVQGE